MPFRAPQSESKAMPSPVTITPRRLTNGEAQSLAEDYPQIDAAKVWVIGEAAGAYNSVAWTLGITDRWIWPGASLGRFNGFYVAHRDRLRAESALAGYGTPADGIRHVALRINVHVGGANLGRAWTSKLGGSLLIMHGFTDLAGSTSGYGNVIQEYAPRSTPDRGPPRPSRASPVPPLFSPSVDERGELARRALALHPALRVRFEATYAAWQATWSEASIRTSSDPEARARSAEFRDVIALEDIALPLLMMKLTDPAGFFALQAIDKLLPPRAKVRFEFDDPAILGGEQHRAAETLRRWLAAGG